MSCTVPQLVSRVGASVLRASGQAGAAARRTQQRASAATWPSPAHGLGFAARSTNRGHSAASSASAAPAVADAPPKAIYLSEYAAPDYAFAKVALDFNLGEERTVVGNTVSVEPTYTGGVSRPLFLNGDPCVELTSIEVDGKALPPSAFVLTPKGLTITAPPTEPFTLVITTVIKPQDNTELEGLYKSSGNFCTQCEAEGFRRITFFQVRMAAFRGHPLIEAAPPSIPQHRHKHHPHGFPQRSQTVLAHVVKTPAGWLLTPVTVCDALHVPTPGPYSRQRHVVLQHSLLPGPAGRDVRLYHHHHRR